MSIRTTSLALGLLALVSSASAVLVTSAAGFVSPSVVDFNGIGASGFVQTAGPLQVSTVPGLSVVYTSTSTSSEIGAASYNLVFNGTWDAAKTSFVGVNDATATVSFTLANATSSIGGFVNYAPFGNGQPIITARGAGGVLLETYDLSVSAPISTFFQTNQGGFRGISRATSDIVSFDVTGGFLVLDDLTIAKPVPEPASMAALAVGALGLLRRRRKA